MGRADTMLSPEPAASSVNGHGQRFTVTFTERQVSLHPCGYWQGYKILPAYHTYAVKVGETWLVEEVLRWESGSGRPENNLHRDLDQWGPVIYAWPVMRLG